MLDKGSRLPTPLAREPRAIPTDAEVRLWRALSAKKVANTRFSRQHPIGPYVCAFVARSPRLVVEVGGSQHDQAKDAQRTFYLQNQGYQVIRFENTDVLVDLEGVIAEIERVLATIPSMPSPKREKSLSTARQAADAAGRRGETYAAAWLERRGWTVLDQRVKTKIGEVDLVARRAGLVAFVEVKVRRSAAELDHAIDEARLARVAAAAELLAERFLEPGDDMRVDVILLAKGCVPRVIENAWLP